MAKARLDIGIPQQSLVYIGLCVIGLLIFVLGGILPAANRIAALDAEIAAARYRLEEQKALAPFLQKLEKQEGGRARATLPLPQRGKLPQAKIGTLPQNLGELAKSSGMTLLSATPNLNNLAADSPLMPVGVTLRGSFNDFRRFLIGLGGLPYVERIEEIVIQERPGTREYRLLLAVAVG